MCDPTKLTNLYLDVFSDALEAEHSEVCDDGAVRAIVDGLTVVAMNHAPADPEFLHVWTAVPINLDLAAMRRMCEDVNGRVFGAKLIPLADGNCVCTIETPIAGDSCLPDREFLAHVLRSALGLITAALEHTRVAVTLYGIEAASVDTTVA